MTVNARRLDAPAPPVETSGGLGGYREDSKSFLVGGIDFPASGCWEVSAHYESDALTFVVWIPDDTAAVSKAASVYVVGDVRKPMGVVIENSDHITVLQALATAEGVNPTASLRNARIVRKDDNGPTEIPLDLKKIMQGKALDVPLQAGDILFVPAGAANIAKREVLPHSPIL